MAPQIASLEAEVNRAMEEGWFPTGGVCEVIGGKMFLQPMVLYPVYSARKSEGSSVTWASPITAQVADVEVVVIGGDNGSD